MLPDKSEVDFILHLVSHQAHNLKVVSSNLAPAPK